MSLVTLKCPNCTGKLEFEDSREFGFCQYCGYKVMIQQEINNTINNYNNTTIFTDDKAEQNKKIMAAAEKALSERNYESAEELAKSVLERDVTFANAYLAILLSQAHKKFDMQKYLSESDRAALQQYFDKYHLYSSDSRSMKEIISSIGINYNFEELFENYNKAEMEKITASAEKRLKDLNSAIRHAGYSDTVNESQMNALIELIGPISLYPYYYTYPLSKYLEEYIIRFNDFSFALDGKQTTFVAEYEKIFSLKKAVQSFYTVMKDYKIDENSISKYEQSYQDCVDKLYPITGLKKLMNKSINESCKNE